VKLYNHEIDPNSTVSIGDQIKRILEKEIESGRWEDGSRLPTAREISRLVGVSSTTVSKALTSLAEEGTVLRHVGRGSFLRPSNRTSRRRTGSIGVIQGDSWHPGHAVSSRQPFYHNMLEQINAELAAWDYSCQLFHEDSLKQPVAEHEPAQMTHGKIHQVDGLLILGAIPSSLYQQVQQRDLPAVCIGTEESPEGVPYVAVDTRLEIWSAFDRLYQTGHRRIGLIHSFPTLGFRRFRLRLDAFYAACSEANLPCGENLVLDLGPENGGQLARVREFIAASELPLGLICTSASAAKAVYEVSTLLGLKIPEHLSLISLSAIPGFGSDFQPPISTLLADIQAMSRYSVQMLLEMIHRRQKPLCMGNLVRSLWTPGGSVSAPRQAPLDTGEVDFSSVTVTAED